MAGQKRTELSETSAIRWFCYLGFISCSVSLVVVLALGLSWWAPLVGTLVYGVPALSMYRQEEQRRENFAVVQMAQRARSGGGFDFSEDDDDDPTTPPPGPRSIR